jgi:hypothetical protein
MLAIRLRELQAKASSVMAFLILVEVSRRRRASTAFYSPVELTAEQEARIKNETEKLNLLEHIEKENQRRIQDKREFFERIDRNFQEIERYFNEGNWMLADSWLSLVWEELLDA